MPQAKRLPTKMKSLRHRAVLAAGVLSVLAALPHLVLSQNLNPAELLHPSADSWPGYHGDYSGRRHSHLTQITPQNVGKLSLAWAFQTDQTAQIKSSPLLVDGVLYFTVPENIWAVDARSGHQLWHYTYPPARATTSAIVAWACIRGGSISRLRIATWSR